jgi:AraC-like DNA-binding protein
VLLKDFLPAADVQELVQLYRIVHLQFPQGQRIPVKAYPPRPEHCLAFYPYDRETVSYQNSGKVVNNLPVVLYGQFTEVTNRKIGHQFLVFQIIFYPGALYRLTGMPAANLLNQYLDATTVFGRQLHDVNEQLYEAKNYEQMIAVANNFVRQLQQKIKKPRLMLDEAFAWLLQSHNAINIDALARAACLSARQLERNFKDRIGVNPKLYQRIIRFDKTFRLKNSQPHLDWLRIAMQQDYHDYQHLAKTYKEFTGYSPTAFHAIENDAPERQFGLSEGYYT